MTKMSCSITRALCALVLALGIASPLTAREAFPTTRDAMDEGTRQAPVVGADPDSLYAELFTGGVDVQTLTLSNAGGSDLVWEIDITEPDGLRVQEYLLAVPDPQSAPADRSDVGGAPPAPRQAPLRARLADLTDVIVLWDRAHGQPPWTYEWLVMVSDLESRGATMVETSSPITPALLADVDVLWTTDCELPCDVPWTGDEVSAVADWVLDGGGLLLAGDSSFSVTAFNSLLAAMAAGISYSTVDGIGGTTTYIYPHEATADVTAVLIENPTAYLSSVAAPAGLLIEDIAGFPSSAFSLRGLGRIVALTEDLLYDGAIGEADNRLFGNQVFDWLALGGLDWLSVDPAAGTVPAGGSLELAVTFDAARLYGGDYLANLMVLSNDPVTPALRVATNLSVTGAPDIDLDPEGFDFGPVFIGGTVTEALLVSNAGTDLLTVTGLVSDHPDFTVDPTSFALAPWETQAVTVAFSPSSAAQIRGSLTVISDDPDEVTHRVSVRGEGLLPPVVGANPDSLYADLSTGDVDVQTLTLSNTGASDLVWGIDIRQERDSDRARPLAFYSDDFRLTLAPGDLPRSPGGLKGAPAGAGAKERDLGNVLATYAGIPGSNVGAVWAGGFLYVLSWDDHRIYKYDPASQSVLDSFSVYSGSYSIAWDGDHLWVGHRYGYIFAYDLSGNPAGYFISPVFDFSTVTWDGSYLLVHESFASLDEIYRVDVDGTVVDVYSSNYAGSLSGTTWVPEHPGGELWAYDGDQSQIVQLDVVGGVVEFVQGYPFYDDNFAHTLAHDGRDLWWADLDGPLFQLEDGIAEISWLSLDPAAGTLPAGGSLDLAVTFDAAGLYGGDYQADLSVLSNDPISPALRVATHLHVTGTPDIDLDPESFDFGPVYIGVTKSDTLLVSNLGTDLLTVAAFVSDHPDFTLDPVSFPLPPGESRAVTVSFCPSSEGGITGTLAVTSDDPDEGTLMVPMAGEGLASPVVDTDPDSLHAELFTGGVDVQTLTLSNAGGSDLVWEIDIREPDGLLRRESPLRDLTDVTVLWDAAHTQYWIGNWSTIVSDLESRGATVVENSLPITPALLADVDVFCSTDCYVNNWTGAEIAALAEWVLGGGGVLFGGDNDSSVEAYNLLLDAMAAGIGYSTVNGARGITTQIYPHETTADVMAIEIGDYVGAHLSAVVAPAGMLIEDCAGVPNSAYSRVNQGRVVALAVDLLANSIIAEAHNQRFGNQVFDWLALGGVDLLSVDPAAGTLPAGGSMNLAITFDAAWLYGGDYLSDLMFLSNDPVTPELRVPTHLHVTGAPDSDLDPEDLDFGPVFIGATATEALLVSNAGTDLLTVTGLVADHPDFSVDPTSFALAPGESQAVTVAFSPSSAALITGTLTVTSDDPDEGTQWVPVAGEGLLPPVVGADPDSLYAELFTGGVDVQALTLSNTGTSDLVWEIEIQQERGSDRARPLGFYADDTSLSLSRRDLPQESRALLPEALTRAGAAERDLSDVLATYEGLPVSNVGAVWADGFLYVLSWDDDRIYKYDLASESVLDFFYVNNGSLSIAWDGDYLWVGQSSGNIYAYDFSGNPVGSFTGPVDYPTVTWDGSYLLVHESFSSLDKIYRVDIDGTVVDVYSSNYAGSLLGTTWVPEHPGGELWAYDDDQSQIVQLDVVGGVVEFVQGFPFEDDNVAYTLAHDGKDLWWADLDGPLFQLDDGIAEISCLSVEPAAGTLPAGASLNMAVTFDAAGLHGGEYLADLNVLSNDPITPALRVATHLHVTGAPDITLDPESFNFGPVHIGTTVTAALIVANAGTELLTVTDIVSDHSDFSAEPTFLALAPGESQAVTVSFCPSSEAVITGTLTVVSDDPDGGTRLVPLAGEGLVPPVVGADPDSLYADLFTGDLEVQTLTLRNTGGSDLDWEIGIVKPDSLRRQERRLADLTNVTVLWDVSHGQPSWTNGWSLIVNALESRGATVLESSSPIDPALLAEVDVFWTTDFLYSWTQAEIAALADWVRGGGGFLLEGDNSTSVAVYNLMLDAMAAGIVYSTGGGTAGTTDHIHPHETTADVTTIQIDDPLAHLSSIEAPAGSLIEDAAGVPNSAYGLPGLGRIVALADELLIINAADNQLFGNQVFDWLALGGVDWLDVNPVSGTLPAGGNVDLAVTFNAARLEGGDYLVDLMVRSNDPLTPELPVTTHLLVTGAPDIALSTDEIDFGIVLLGLAKLDTLLVENAGTEWLSVTSISADHPDFSAAPTEFSLPPGLGQIVEVTYEPGSAGPVDASLTIESNDPGEPVATVSLLGEGVLPPEITVDPESLLVVLAPGETAVRELSISNSGGSDLSWEITIAERAASAGGMRRAPGDRDEMDYLGIFGDTGGTFCAGDVIPLVMFSCHLLAHVPDFPGGITAVEFSLGNYQGNPGGPLGITIFEWAAPLVIGDPETGISLAFATPQVPDANGNVPLGTMNVFALSPDWIGPDHRVSMEPYPGQVAIRVFDDLYAMHLVPGSYFTFNCNADCGCFIPTGLPSGWLDVDPHVGAVPPAEAQAVSVQIDAGDLQNGFFYKVLQIASNDLDDPLILIPVTLRVDDSVDIDEPELPFTTVLLPAFPNPFNPHVTVPFTLAGTQRVRIAVYDIGGRRVIQLCDRRFERGRQELTWTGRDETAGPVASGVYIIRMEAQGYARSQKLILLR